MDIEFKCYHCGQPVVIDAAGAGQSVQCPKCGQLLTVPKATAIPPLPATPPPFPAVNPPVSSDTKTCHFCAETIKREARVCRFCGYNLETGQPQKASQPQNAPPQTVEAQSSIGSGVKIGVGMFIVLPAIIIAVIILGIVGLLCMGALKMLIDSLGTTLGVIIFIVVPSLAGIGAVGALLRKRGKHLPIAVLAVSAILLLLGLLFLTN